MGKIEVDSIFKQIIDLKLLPEQQRNCLDFGCGVGRLSRALLSHYDHVTGIDVSESMIQQANEFNTEFEKKLNFIHNKENKLSMIEDNSFDSVFTTIVLQHIPQAISVNYIKEFIRICRPKGIIIFQLPVASFLNPGFLQRIRQKIKIRERLAMIGLGSGFQMEMHVVSEDAVKSIAKNANCEILKSFSTNHTDPSFDGNIQYDVESNKNFGYLSKLYIIRKN